MSVLFMVLVSSVAAMKAGRKMATPITSRIQLAKLSCAIIVYVRTAVRADERRIFADEGQFTVTL